MKPLVLVVAMSENRVIGKDGTLPWRLPEDLKHFKAVTLGHPIIMGRKTHESIGRPLPGRENIVVTRNPDLTFEGCQRAGSLQDALDIAYSLDEAPRVIGGGTLYAEALPLATRIYLTEVQRVVFGDTYFPELDRTAWRESESKDGDGVRFVTLDRTTLAP